MGCHLISLSIKTLYHFVVGIRPCLQIVFIHLMDFSRPYLTLSVASDHLHFGVLPSMGRGKKVLSLVVGMAQLSLRIGTLMIISCKRGQNNDARASVI